VKDAVYTGPDVASAVAEAAQSLGLAPERLRYVVLDPGSPPRLGSSGTPARIAVLLGAPPPAEAPQPALAPPADPVHGIELVLAAVLREGDLGVRVSVEDGPDALRVRLEGPDEGVFLKEQGELLDALEHLLQRMFGDQLRPRRVLLDCGGRRARREDALRELARQLSEAVRQDGQPRSTPEPLNAYERRIVHMAVAEQPGLRSFSLGAAREKRVTVAPADAPQPDPGE
jgi:spoIIIJ-associated protein